MKNFLKWLVVIALAPLPFFAAALLITQPDRPLKDSVSAQWLMPGPYQVAEQDLTLTDDRRPTNANGSFTGANERVLLTTVWSPKEAAGPRPLLVYSHGFISDRAGGRYLAEQLASYGYVVVAPNFPLTNRLAPGGPNVSDVANQPGDVSHVIDVMLGAAGQQPVLPLAIDADRIGVLGLSLGGLTSTLVGYHPRWRDPRVKAVLSIAGLGFMLQDAFYQHGDAPYMMIGGTMDTVVPYQDNAAPVIDRVPGSVLVTVDGGSHVGFSHFSEPFGRFMHNPDSLSCSAIRANIDVESEENPLAVLGELNEGILFTDSAPAICAVDPLPESMNPGRQHMITAVATLAFFEQHMAQDENRRSNAQALIERHLAQDFAEATVTIAPSRQEAL